MVKHAGLQIPSRAERCSLCCIICKSELLEGETATEINNNNYSKRLLAVGLDKDKSFVIQAAPIVILQIAPKVVIQAAPMVILVAPTVVIQIASKVACRALKGCYWGVRQELFLRERKRPVFLLLERRKAPKGWQWVWVSGTKALLSGPLAQTQR